MDEPKSMIQLSAERRDKSIPVTRGFRTSAFGLPFGLAGNRSHSRARLARDVKGTVFVHPQERDSPVAVQSRSLCQVRTPFCKIGIDASLRDTVQEGGQSGVLVSKANQRYPNGRAVNGPGFVRPSIKNDAAFSNVVGVRRDSSRLGWSCRHEAGTGNFAFGYHLPAFWNQ